jgi:hypothetical protein
MGKDPSEIDQEVSSRKGRRSQAGDQVREQVGQAGERVAQTVRNPLGMAIGAVAVGFLVGLIIPTTPIEESTLPQVRDKIEDQINAADLMGRASRVLEETKRAATHAVQEEARGASEALAARNREQA